MSPWIKKLVLENDKVILNPLKNTHKSELIKAASDGKLWELWYTSVPSEKTIDSYISNALAQKDKHLEYPFTIIDKKTNKIIGSTRFYNLQPEHRRLEIGYTWIAKSYQKTGINWASKYLLLEYAFEKLNCIAVQLVTDWNNLNSRNAILKLGAKQDGVLRNHRINNDGTYRDTVVFSITENEWPNVKKSLQYRLKK